ncbi:Hypothetical protein KVN_LOCUS459 [uncultured virus]|nr:Hypothetical protein KVN_LOCUS459 [uncultured virus]
MNEELLMENINLNDIVFVKDKTNYKIFFKKGPNYEKLVIKSPIIKVPFGIEKYNNKDIINLEFTDLGKNNDIYNFHTKIKNIDNFIRKIFMDKEIQSNLKYKVNLDLVNQLSKKYYLSCIKNRPENFPPLMRTHLKYKNKNILTEFNSLKNKNITSISQLKKNTNGYFFIELAFLWVNTDSFGLTWYVNNCFIN